MDTNHTPGPWEFEIPNTSYDAVVSNNANWSIATVHGSGKKTALRKTADSLKLHSEGVANARLIAAAPDLLEACKLADELAANLDCIAGVSAEGRKAKGFGIKLHRLLTAAIAKAEGAK